MGWVTEALRELKEGRVARVPPQGGSMRGRIESGQLVEISPVSPSDVRADDVIFVGWKGSYILHIVKEIQDGQFLIGNNLGKINGWAGAEAICGKVTAIDESPST